MRSHKTRRPGLSSAKAASRIVDALQPSLAELGAPDRTALLVVDVQNDFVDPEGRVGRSGADMRPLQAAAEQINDLISAARGARVPVFYITVEHGPDVDRPPYQARYARRGMTPEHTICHAGTWGADLYRGLTKPVAGEARMVKHGYDAFQIPELAGALKRAKVQSVVVVGVVTELCVRATATSAFENGLFVIVPRECTASSEPERGAEALDSIQRWYGEVVPVEELTQVWNAASIGAEAATS